MNIHMNPTLYELIKKVKYQEIDYLLSNNPIDLNVGMVNLKYDEFSATENYLSLGIKTVNFKLIETLLKHGANPNYQEIDKWGNNSYSPASNLFTIYIFNETIRHELLELLVKYGLNVNIITSMQDSLLLQATHVICNDSINNFITLDYLLEQGAFINHNSAGQTALSVAIEKKNENLAFYLLEKGSDANTKYIQKMSEYNNLANQVLIYSKAEKEKKLLEDIIENKPSSIKLKI